MLGEFTFTKVAALIVILSTSVAGGYKALDIASNDGEWKGVMTVEMRIVKEDIKEMRKDIKELLRMAIQQGVKK